MARHVNEKASQQMSSNAYFCDVYHSPIVAEISLLCWDGLMDRRRYLCITSKQSPEYQYTLKLLIISYTVRGKLFEIVH